MTTIRKIINLCYLKQQSEKLLLDGCELLPNPKTGCANDIRLAMHSLRDLIGEAIKKGTSLIRPVLIFKKDGICTNNISITRPLLNKTESQFFAGDEFVIFHFVLEKKILLIEVNENFSSGKKMRIIAVQKDKKITIPQDMIAESITAYSISCLKNPKMLIVEYQN